MKKTFSQKMPWQILLAIPFCFVSLEVYAQIIPDTTLPTNSLVTPNGNTFIINGGTTAGSNLFHSFQEFSIPTDAEAFFKNSSNIHNIFNRVTGGKVSNIDGIIRSNGTANLFFINPSGIIFSTNARLNIGGSFIGSTANSIGFNDGFIFSAINPQFTELLTVNVPVGLQFGQNSGITGIIRVDGRGHGFIATNATFASINRSNRNIGLQVKPNQTLALIGGNINMEGGVLTAEGGRIELGSVAQGSVTLISTIVNGLELTYEGVQNFEDISLSRQSAVDASGVTRGTIQIAARQVTLTDGSLALIQTQGNEAGGNITVTASNLLKLIGTTSDATVRSGLVSETVGFGRGSNINVSTRQLVLQDGAAIIFRTFGNGDAGDISVNSLNLIEVRGVSPINPIVFSLIGGQPASSGNGGNVTLSTRQLSLINGGNVATPTFGNGRAGNVTVNVSELTEVIGTNSDSTISSSLGSSSASSGNAGILTINTKRLFIGNGGTINTSAFASGNAGSIVVNASDSIEVSGKPNVGLPSRIVSAGIIQNETVRRAFGLPDRPSGNSDTVTINTPRLTIADGARVSAANQGTGIAGNVNINAGSILLLDSAGGITASTASGEGGNINITTDFLQLRRASQISTQAGGAGNGGNLNINANTLAILEDSQVNANAFQGAGGNIRISSQGLFASPDSQITASSQLGVSGTININSPEVNTATALVELPQNLVDPTQQVVAACASRKGNTFTITGRGGLIENPTLPQSSEDIWQDWTYYNIPETNSTRIKRQITEEQHPQLVEATSWRLENGKVELIGVIASNQSNYRENPQSICE